MEAFPTVVARVRPSIRVNEQVRRQGGRSLEGFPTLFTFENFLYVMNSSEMEKRKSLIEKVVDGEAIRFLSQGVLSETHLC